MPNFSRSSFIPKSVALSPKCIKDPLVLELKSLNNNMRRVDAYIVLGLNGKRKLKDEEEKRNKQSKRRERESSLERQRKANPLQFFKDSLPRTGFLDAIRNFILYTVMGKMVPFVLKNLPAILNATKLLIPVYNFFENFLGNTLNGLVNAIDFGYNIHDKMRKILKDVTGNKFEKTFDDLEKNLNTFLNVAIIAGLAIGGAGIGRLAKFKKTGINSLNVNQLKKLAKERGLKNYGKLKKTELVDLLENKPKPNVINPPTKRPKIPSIPGAKFFGKFGKVFGRIPIVGGLIDFALSLMFGEKIGRAAARAVGSTLGAALGTFIPVPGVGTIIGGILGDIVGGALYDTLESFNSPKKMASGGQVGRKYANVTRKIRAKRIQKPTKQITQRTMPGKNVGGRENIEKLFPSSDDPNTMSPLRVLTKNSSVMKGGGVLGKFLSSGVELMALGQKMERSTLIGLEKYLAYVIDSSIQDQSNENSKRIAGSMLAMAEGGLVPVSRTITEKASPGSIVAKDIVKSFNSTMNTKSAEILQNIKKEISLFKPGATPGDIKSGFGESGSFVSGDYEELLNLIAEKESKDSGGYNAYNEGGAGGGYQVIGYSGPAINGPIGKNLTDMTIAEIMEHQANKNPPIHAAGRYQIIGQTMKGLLSGRYGDTGVKTTDKFTPEIQDKLAIALIRSRLSTGANTKNFINEWRGLLFVDQNKLQSAIEKAKGGKITPKVYGDSTFINPVPSVNFNLNPGGYEADSGLDIIGPEGVDVVAAFSGKIIYAERGHSAQMGQSSSSRGYKEQHSVLIELDNPFNFNGKLIRYAWYSHLQELDPSIAGKNGKHIKAGQRLGALGIANKVPHLHFGLLGDRQQNIFLKHTEIRQLFNKSSKKNNRISSASPMKLSSKQETQTPANYISNKKTYTDATKETQILIQPILT
jgi:murein DD-endopeptidase MepM/ murein hydrolase activator NlpD